MPRPRFERLDADKRAAILDAAEEEFAAHGFGHASYNRIIERAGVSKGAMYYYFDDKADLYLTVIRRAFSGLLQVLGEVGEEVAEPEAFWAECDALMMRAAAYFMADPRRGELARGLVRSLGEAPASVHEVLGEAREPMRRILEVGQRAGAVRDDLPLDLLVAVASGVGQAIDVWLSTHWDSLPPGGFAALERKLMDVFRRLCAPGPEPGGAESP